MNSDRAIETLAALAQPTRMSIFKHLVRIGPKGVQVGEISRELDIVPSTLSGHLTILRQAGLVHATRKQREIHYAVRLEAISELVAFILADCCDGRIENCGEVMALLKRP